MCIAYMIPAFILKMVTLMPDVSSVILSHHMHQDCSVESTLTVDEFNMSTACWAALHVLYLREVDSIQICEAMRIEAPLSGYLIDATGIWNEGERQYTLFRIGIRDDEEDPSRAGNEFVFLAAGFNENGEAYYYPATAGIEDPDGNFSLEREYLLNEEEFLSIPQRFPQ